jgi:hypothetical protein
MSTDIFSYPELDQVYAESYLHALIIYLKNKKENKIVNLLEDSECRVETSTNFSRGRRWNAYKMKVYFYVAVDKFVGLDETENRTLLKYCNDIVDRTYGYDVTQSEIIPIPRIDTSTEEKMSREIIRIQDLVQKTLSRNILPEDMLEKGRQMTHVCLYLYCVENSLRKLIEDVGREKEGPDYFDKITINKRVREKIESRKEEEKTTNWVRLRGDSDIFYMDFTELGLLIENNWSMFKDHFDSSQWIKTRIDELAKLRNRVAHNSYLGEDEQEMIRSHYKSILKQLGVQQRST